MPHLCGQAGHLVRGTHLTPGMVRCTSSTSSLLCTLNLLLIGLGLTTIAVICWLEDGAVKNSSAVLIAIPCFAIFSGFFGCVSQFQDGCLRIHIAAVIASMVLLVGGFCIMTIRKDEVVTQIVQWGENPSVASGVVSWSQILFLLMVCAQVVVLLSAGLKSCCNVFIRQKAKARDREFARHLRRIVGGCPCPTAKGLPDPGAGRNGTLPRPTSRTPQLRVPGYDNDTAAGDLCQQTRCGEDADDLQLVAPRVTNTRSARPWRSVARSTTDMRSREPLRFPSYVAPVPLSMEQIMKEIPHSGSLETVKELEETGPIETEWEYEDVENPDADGAASDFDASCSSISPSLHSAKSELITDIQEATLKMRSRMPDPDFFAVSATRKVCEITESEMYSDGV